MERKTRSTLPSHRLGRERCHDGRGKSEQSKRNRVCNSNLPHTRSATGRGRAEHSGGDEEVASVFRSEKKLLGGKGGGGGGGLVVVVGGRG